MTGLVGASAASTGIVVGVLGFLCITVAIGIVTVKFVKGSSRRYIVAGKSLPLFFIGTMLSAQAIEGISGILMMISFMVLVAGNFAASGFILERVFGIDFLLAVFIAAAIVLTYTAFGGLFSCAY